MKKKEMVQQLNDLQFDLEKCRKEIEKVRYAVHEDAFKVYRLGDSMLEVRSWIRKQDSDTTELRKQLESLRSCCKNNNDFNWSRVNKLEAAFKELKCQVETKHRKLKYAWQERGDSGQCVYAFRCDCGFFVRKTVDELTMKDREALIALGLLEV